MRERRVHSRTYRERLHLFDDGVSLRGREDDRRARRLRRASDRFLRARRRGIHDTRHGQSRGMGQIAIQPAIVIRLERAARAHRIAVHARARFPQNITHTRHPRVTRDRAQYARTTPDPRHARPSRRHSRQGSVASSSSRHSSRTTRTRRIRTLETLVANAGEATTRAAVAEIVKDIV